MNLMLLEKGKKTAMSRSCSSNAVVELDIHQLKPVVSPPYHWSSNTPLFNTTSPLCFFVLKLPSCSLNVLFSSNPFFVWLYFSCQLTTVSSFSTLLMTTLISHLGFSLLHEFSCDFIQSMAPTHSGPPSPSLSHTLYTHIHTPMHIQLAPCNVQP